MTGPILVRRIYPAAVQIGQQRITGTLAFIVRHGGALRLEVWRDISGKPALSCSTTLDEDASEIPPPYAPQSTPTVGLTASGDRFSIVTGHGCGCGSLLKAYAPYTRAGV